MSRDEAKAATRQKILRGAREVFADKGYHGALVDDIVRVSGTSKGAVYHHFPTKQALFVALVDEFASHLATAVTQAIEGRHGALAKVEGALRAGLETFARHRELARILLLEAMSLGETYEAKRTEVHSRFAALIRAYLDEAVAEGSIPPLNTEVATFAWLGAVNEVVIQWLHTGRPDLPTEALPALTELLLRSIGAGTSPSA
ncbi:MAG: TetR/AcrR family transcriptional regulator [Candidatus Methylomirabilia bacterium]